MTTARAARAAVRRGRDWENDVGTLAMKIGFPKIDRRVKHGWQDEGDHVGFPGLTTEAKARRDSGSITMGIRELKQEMIATGDLWGVVLQKVPGKSTEEGIAAMPLLMFLELWFDYCRLREAAGRRLE